MNIKNIAKNQTIIYDDYGNTYFQSYDSKIVMIDKKGKVILDKDYWDYSKTTAKYRNEFLNETTQEIKKKIADKTYKLGNLNGQKN